MSVFSRVDCNGWNLISALWFYCIGQLLGDCCFCSDSSVRSFAYCETLLLRFILLRVSFFLGGGILAFLLTPEKFLCLGK